MNHTGRSACSRSTLRLAAWAVLVALLSGCQQTLMMMPTPEVMRTGEVDVFQKTPEWERTLEIPVVYATNRLPDKRMDERGYTRKFDDRLRLGVARIRVGDDPDASWDELYEASLDPDRGLDVPLKLVRVNEYVLLEPGTDPAQPGEAALELIGALNDYLAESEDPDLLIFVHGANNNFYRSIGQAAQYRHFTGRHTAVLAFVWPSMENILRYGADVKHAEQAAPMLADLLAMVGVHSNARHINLLGYSLGATVVSNALEDLRRRHAERPAAEVREKLRLGEIYFAAPDVDFERFVDQLYVYEDIVGRVTMTINMEDSALGFSAMVQGKSRAGRPDTDELTTEQTNRLLRATRSPRFDVIEVSEAIAPYEALKAHDYWYNNPRVSTDVLLQMLSHETPDKRGLEKYVTDKGYKIWIFPQNYQERSLEAVRRMRSERE
jgi:pimeloyl-ACP methyl ester carboxylesterase